MEREETLIPGCAVLSLFSHGDERGDFVKVFQRSAARTAGDDPDIAEIFWSRSARGVIRGLHFQTPPHAHAKLVTVIAGDVLDVVVDLRIGSPTFGRAVTIDLAGTRPAAVVVPPGCAHGFQALTDGTIVAYATSTEHVPDADAGIRWDSVGAQWPIASPIVSARDSGFPARADFESPFTFSAP